MISVPSGVKVNLNITRPSQAMEHAQGTSFTGRMEFTFNLKSVHLFWSNGKPIGAVMMPKFGVDAVYGSTVVDKMPQLIKTVLKIELYTCSPDEIIQLMSEHPEAALVEQIMDIDEIPQFIKRADEKTIKLLKMILFSRGNPSVEAMKTSFTMPPLADYSPAEFDEAFSNLISERVITTDGVGVHMPRYLQLILKNEIVNSILDGGELKDVLNDEDPFVRDFFKELKKHDGTVAYRTLKDSYQDAKHKYRLYEVGDTLLEKGVLIEGVDEKGETLYIIPLEILENLENIKTDKKDTKVSREDLKKQLMEKFKIREPDRDQIKNIVTKFYEE